MSDYSQPDFYRFNEDSILLVRFIKENFPSAKSILDLGAGCGILGIELANHFKSQHLTLVELQNDFLSHLDMNLLSFLNPFTKAEIKLISFAQFESNEMYDLVVSNPPYYLKGQGEESKDPRRGFARSFQHEGWSELITSITRSLSPTGKAFIVIKDNPEIKKEYSKFIKHLDHKIHQLKNLEILELAGLDKN